MPSETEKNAQAPEAAPGAEAKTPQVTDDLVQDLNSGKKSLRDLPRDQQKAVMERVKREAAGEPAVGQETAPEPAPRAKEAEGEKPATEPEAEKPAPRERKPFDVKRARREHQRMADEANEWEQKLTSMRMRHGKVKKEFETELSKEVPAPEDPWDKEHQTKLAREVETLKKQNEMLLQRFQEMEEKEIDSVSKTAQEKRDQELFGQIHDLQDEYPDQLGMEKPFREYNDDYAAWTEKMISASGVKEKLPKDASPEQIHEAAVKRFNSDPEFAKSIPDLPIPEADRDRFNTLLDLHHRRKRQGGSIKGHWLEDLDEQGVLEKVVQRGRKEAAEDATTRTVKSIQKQESAVQPISPSDASGPGYQETGLTVDQAAAIQRKLVDKQRSGGRLSPQEREQLKRVNDVIRSEFVRA